MIYFSFKIKIKQNLKKFVYKNINQKIIFILKQL